MMTIEEQIKYDTMQFLAFIMYTALVFLFGCAVMFLVFTLTPKTTKPTNYILPDAPASGMYVSSNKFSF